MPLEGRTVYSSIPIIKSLSSYLVVGALSFFYLATVM